MKVKFIAFLIFILYSVSVFAEPTHAIAMHGYPKYPANFTHFDYVNPDAPKGGILREASFGSFDTFNPFVIKGNSAPGNGLIFETLMTSSSDEPFSEYGLIAEKVEMPQDRSWVAFQINPKAKFSDGTPVTADDVVFTFETLRDKGVPQYRYYYSGVDKVEATDKLRVLFTFKDKNNRELPLILGQMPVLSRKDWQGKDFEATTLQMPLGSGAYRLKEFELNRYIVYERDPNYWGADLPVNRGMNNFNEIRYDIYRDTAVAVEALKAGAYDVRVENEAKKWATAYDIPAVEEGELIKKEFTHGLPSGMQGFVMNTRRPIFADIKVREAMQYVLDFNWLNDKLFHGSYIRTKSFFDNSDLAATGLPKEDELALLKPFKEQLDERVFTQEIYVPELDSKNPRPQLLKALDLLKQAGWEVKDGVLKNAQGQPFEFEILLDSSGASAWERIALPFVRNLKKIGITARIRVMDALQYKHKLDSFDFDMFVMVWGQSLSPGNEQLYFWGSEAANQNGSYNFAGIQSPVVDGLIEKIIGANTREDLLAATRALDRVLMWGFYVIPQWHTNKTRIVYWDKFGMPDVTPLHGPSVMTWWVK
ncbi:MAG: ABC transporter substrate-binding protein [Alphaproteobacteria bacterium]|nr:ABC transporter substrate-binding protein [Alphaproteobacteria bacterium]